MRCRKARSRPCGWKKQRGGPLPGNPGRFRASKRRRSCGPRDPLNDATAFLSPRAREELLDAVGGSISDIHLAPRFEQEDLD